MMLRTRVRKPVGTFAAIMLAALVAGCSQTAAPGPNIAQRVEGEMRGTASRGGFLGGDYSLLQAGAPGIWSRRRCWPTSIQVPPGAATTRS